MGGCCSALSMEDPLESHQHPPHQSQILHDDGIAGGDGVWPFTEFSFSDLQTATKNFSSGEILSENGEESYNVVYKGRLQNNLGFIAIKKFNNTPWPDPDDFAENAQRVGKLKHKRVVKLIGYCCDGDKRLLVSEFLPNDTLAKRLFHQKNETMEWSMRLRVACCVAEALDYCRASGFTSYNNLSAYTVLLDECGDACLSCFGLMKEINGYRRTTERRVNIESVTYRFGTILVNLLSGKQIHPSHALEMIKGKNVTELMDPSLEGKFSTEEATVVFKLASECLQYEDRESLITKDLVATLKILQTQTQVPSFEMTKHQEERTSSSQQQQLEPLQTKTEVPSNEMKEASSSIQLSPLGEACLRMDLNAIHEILVITKYKDDKEVTEYSFEEWLPSMDGVHTVLNFGDEAFKDKDFKLAITCYSQFIEARNLVYPSVYLRRSLSYLFRNQTEAALQDVIKAKEVFPDWPMAFYLHSLVLTKLGKNIESDDIFDKATLLEAKRQNNVV